MSGRRNRETGIVTNETGSPGPPASTTTAKAPTIGEGKTGERDRAFAKALQAISRHGKMFEAAEAELLHENGGSNGEQIAFRGAGVNFQLRYRTRRKLLARIYHLQLFCEVPSAVPREVPEYRIELQRRGLVNPSFCLVATGRDTEESGNLVAALTGSGLIEDLANEVDLDRFSITWSPQKGGWEVIVEPYPGSHLFKVFPPISYTVWLKQEEVQAILDFLTSIDEFLKEQFDFPRSEREKGEAVEPSER